METYSNWYSDLKVGDTITVPISADVVQSSCRNCVHGCALAVALDAKTGQDNAWAVRRRWGDNNHIATNGIVTFRADESTSGFIDDFDEDIPTDALMEQYGEDGFINATLAVVSINRPTDKERQNAKSS